MRWYRRLVFAIILMASCASSFGQLADSLLLSGTETDFTFADSLSIFNLIDSLLQQGDLDVSQLAVRASYNSNVLSTGRTLGIENFGLSPGISYYLKSGLYADVSGFWSKDFDPAYYLTIASVGYMRDFSKHFSIMAGYDRYFYAVGEDSYVPYKNTLSVTPVLEFKPLQLSATYSFYFGDAHVHRIMPGLGFLFEKKKFLGIDRISITPSIYALYGNETLMEVEFIFPKNWREYRDFKQQYGMGGLKPVETERNVFGLMNVAMSLPITVTHKRWGFSFSYTYSIPKALDGEPLSISESSYLSGSLTYFISLRRNKLPL